LEQVAGELNRDYVRMQRDFEPSGTNWVEIDHLRITRQKIPVGTRADYLVAIQRTADSRLHIYPVSL
jgi:hypothetical protein